MQANRVHLPGVGAEARSAEGWGAGLMERNDNLSQVVLLGGCETAHDLTALQQSASLPGYPKTIQKSMGNASCGAALSSSHPCKAKLSPSPRQKRSGCSSNGTTRSWPSVSTFSARSGERVVGRRCVRAERFCEPQSVLHVGRYQYKLGFPATAVPPGMNARTLNGRKSYGTQRRRDRRACPC
jgi:hypothetical protein